MQANLPLPSRPNTNIQTLDATADHLEEPSAGPESPNKSSTRSTAETRVNSPSAPVDISKLSAVDGAPIFVPVAASGPDDHRPNPSSAPPPPRPVNRLRTTAAKVIQMHRGSTAIQTPGAEQGVDPRRDSASEHWGHIHQECKIEICDYSSVNVRFTPLTNTRLEEFLNGHGHDRPPWAKVRWITVGGISWDVVRTLALRYDLHPLATEDVLRCGENGNRSKGEYFRNHLFLSVISHSLADDDNATSNDPLHAAPPSKALHPGSARGQIVRQLSDSPVQDIQGLHQGLSTVGLRRPLNRDDIESSLSKLNTVDDVSSTSSSIGKEHRPEDDITRITRARRPFPERFTSRRGVRSPDRDVERDAPERKAEEARKLATQKQRASWMSMTPMGRRKAANQVVLEELKQGAHVNVVLKHNYVFLTRQGTLITFHEQADLSVFEPIKRRLRIKDSLLRTNCDASLLMQSVLDLVVDKALDIVERYHDELLDLERKILIKPSMENVRQLHIISGDLTLHKRTLTPLSTLIYTLRRYDLDRAIAATPEAQDSTEVKVTGFCSHQCKVYLADVYDHMDYILSSMDGFSSIAENLLNFTFNIVSYETNNSMSRLTIATVLFFPLTFLTGYFGMNFQQMNSIVGSDLFFWELAIPIMTIVILLLTYPDILNQCRSFLSNRRMDKIEVRELL
ncbi:hypothetical protein CALCODRAFT_436239 [Calocera cornea HHB12733]|uniref:Cora-domain-containing protein n=1 Tax=Calocera cornea HHB12733 TaxID=1353952 RepID=A0A165F3L5_9BASI|nr:hypothetical protein CALCODRAFT_436239 [Calocera cornea HHB12733]